MISGQRWFLPRKDRWGKSFSPYGFSPIIILIGAVCIGSHFPTSAMGIPSPYCAVFRTPATPSDCNTEIRPSAAFVTPSSDPRCVLTVTPTSDVPVAVAKDLILHPATKSAPIMSCPNFRTSVVFPTHMRSTCIDPNGRNLKATALSRSNGRLRGASFSVLRAVPVCASAANCLAEAISFSKLSASWRAPRARVSALEADVWAFSDFDKAFDDAVSACMALDNAVAMESEARCALLPACSICSPSEPITDPARALVFIRENSPVPNPRIRSISERLPREWRASSVRHFVYSAMYSPMQPSTTRPSEAYSQNSQMEDQFEVLRVIVASQNREANSIIVLTVLVEVFLLMKLFAIRRRKKTGQIIPRGDSTAPHPRTPDQSRVQKSSEQERRGCDR